jgi:hypothetical protein
MVDGLMTAVLLEKTRLPLKRARLALARHTH